MKRPMHWVKRVLLAAVAGFLTSVAIWTPLVVLLYGMSPVFYLKWTFWNWQLPLQLATETLPVFVFMLLTRICGTGRPSHPETYCRKCRGVLRNLTEPICTACGERI